MEYSPFAQAELFPMSGQQGGGYQCLWSNLYSLINTCWLWIENGELQRSCRPLPQLGGLRIPLAQIREIGTKYDLIQREHDRRAEHCFSVRYDLGERHGRELIEKLEHGEARVIARRLETARKDATQTAL